MGGGVYGADVAQLRAAASELDRSADRLAAVRTDLGAQLARTPWTGQDAASFRASWDGAHALRLTGAADRLRVAAAVLRRNADAQESTSAASGGSLGALGGPASGPIGGSAQHPPTGSTPAQVSAWWQSLTPFQRKVLLTSHPEQLGVLDGIPAAVRDQANRAVLATELDRLAASEPPRTRTDLALGVPYGGAGLNPAWLVWDERRRSLVSAAAILAGDPSLSLLLLDARGTSRVEVAFATGDVDAADHVGVFTQGLLSNTANAQGVQNAVTSMNQLRAEGERLLLREGRGDETVAMITWMGYDSPQGGDVLVDADAIAGASRLETFSEGVRAINEHAHLSGLGHSYGSLVTSLAAQRTYVFDDVAVFGSPGLRADDGAQLQVPAGHVYALATDWDPVAGSGHFGPVPTHMPGVQALSTAAQGDLSGPSGFPWDRHSQYLVDRSTSQRNLAAVVVGAQDAMIR
ncbi:alpha/beta hydrolase [Microbacterium sp. CJ88]|uniref:alpha/beta hydrolase n=1 Tax=Microbacterium sp. CJ88 TaxID=3445672 RepID=UPI003F65EF26